MSCPSSDCSALRVAKHVVLLGLATLLPLSCSSKESPLPNGQAQGKSGPALTAQELAVPALRGDRLCQDALGFSLVKLDDQLKRDVDAEAKANPVPADPDQGVDSVWWVWSAYSKGLELRVLAAKGAASSSESFTRLTGEIREKLLQSGNYSTPKEELAADARPYSYALQTQDSNAFTIAIVCRSPAAPTESAIAVCVRTLANSPGELRKERESIRFGACT